ncbi:MAG TPA: type II toxin-antitoxin system prevent-host-death family antitoxin [Tepidisphaeraceae bacterium]|nr:type II toxin-antitoxin system prevent-host-death family antitoxin [Tepidisphaeraceae bacterium]
MKTISLKDATGALSEYAQSVNGEPLVIVRRGKPLAALVSLEGADLESAAVSLSPVFQKIIRRSRERQAREGGLSLDEVRRQFGIKPKKRKK